jgi:hypothetical protein
MGAMKLKLFVGVVALYALGAASFALMHRHSEAKVKELHRKVKALGEQHAPLPTPEMKPLQEACQGKLSPGKPHRIAAYVAKLAPSKMPRLQHDYDRVDESVVGVQSLWSFDVSDASLQEIPDAELPRLSDILDVTVWSSHLESARRGNPELNDISYLIAARYESLTAPEVSGGTFSGAEGAYGARVLAFPSGEVLCEGRAEMGMPSRVSAGGRGATQELAAMDAAARAEELVPFVFTKAALISPLHQLCAVGGTELCDKTGYWSSAR